MKKKIKYIMIGIFVTLFSSSIINADYIVTQTIESNSETTLTQYTDLSRFPGCYHIPHNPVIVHTDFGDCYTDFTVDGIKAACRFISGSNHSSITFPEGTLIIDIDNFTGSLFLIDGNNIIIRGAGMDKTRFVVLFGNLTLFELRGYDISFSDVNITLITDENSHPVMLKVNCSYGCIRDMWFATFGYKYFIRKNVVDWI